MIKFDFKKIIILCVIVLPCTHSIINMTCDFSQGDESLNDSHLTVCIRKLIKNSNLEIICPKEVDGDIDISKRIDDIRSLQILDISSNYEKLTHKLFKKPVDYSNINNIKDNEQYSIYPENPNEIISTIVVDDLIKKTIIKNIGIWDVFGTKGENIISKNITKDKEIINIKTPSDGYLTIKKRYILIYICSKPKYLKFCDSNLLNLLINRTYFSTEIDNMKFRIPILNNGDPNIRIGISIILLNDLTILENGCGNVPTKFFNNPAEYDSVNKITQCKIDIMTNPNVGFYCEGKIRPSNCFKHLKNYNNPNHMIFLDYNTYYRDYSTGRNLMQVNYRGYNIHKPFKGYCECLNDQDKVVARIIVERKTEHVCDIPSLLMKNNSKKILNEWCKVTLHPGDSLKILLPINVDNIRKENAIIMKKRDKITSKVHPYIDSSRLTKEDFITPKVKRMEGQVVGEDSDGSEEVEEARDSEREQESGEQQPTSPEDEHTEDDLDSEDLSTIEEEQETSGSEEDIDEEFEGEYLIEEDDDFVDSDDNSISIEDFSDNSSLVISESASEDFEFFDGVLSELETVVKNSDYSYPEVTYPFVTTFSPKDPKRNVNCYSAGSEVMCQVPIDNVFAGDAYEVDDSDKHKGVIKINYRKRPLASKGLIQTLNYYWVLRYRGFNKPEIIAQINVKLAQIHPYSFGCETKFSGVFVPQIDSYYCMYNFNGCTKKHVKHFVYEMSALTNYGINCNENETLYPQNEEIFLINCSTNMISPISSSIEVSNFPSLPKFKLFKKRIDAFQMYSYRCGCLDKEGIETSRLTIYNIKYSLNANIDLLDSDKLIVLLPMVMMFLPKFERMTILDNKRRDLNNSIPEIEFIPVPENITNYKLRLDQGSACTLTAIRPKPLNQTKTIKITGSMPKEVEACYTLDGVRHDEQVKGSMRYTDPSLSKQRLFPSNLSRYFYRVIYGMTYFLIPEEYSSKIATNVAGLKVEVRNMVETDVKNYENLYISLPLGSIVIIKEDEADSIELVFASGAISKPEVTMIDDEASGSEGLNEQENEERSLPEDEEEKQEDHTVDEERLESKHEKVDEEEELEPQPSTSKGIGRFLRINRNKRKEIGVVERKIKQRVMKDKMDEQKKLKLDKEKESRENLDELIKRFDKEMEEQKHIREKEEKRENLEELIKRLGDREKEKSEEETKERSLPEDEEEGTEEGVKLVDEEQEKNKTKINKNQNMYRITKNPVRDIRKMEVWGLYTVIIEATNPWVNGCGATEPSEDFFKPDTEKIIEDGKIIGCRVNIIKKKIAGFYCPEPYKLDPPSCFRHVYEVSEPKGIKFKYKNFEVIDSKNTAFRYVKYTGGRKEFLFPFIKEKVLTCYCKTIYGKQVSKIEIII